MTFSDIKITKCFVTFFSTPTDGHTPVSTNMWCVLNMKSILVSKTLYIHLFSGQRNQNISRSFHQFGDKKILIVSFWQHVFSFVFKTPGNLILIIFSPQIRLQFSCEWLLSINDLYSVSAVMNNCRELDEREHDDG